MDEVERVIKALENPNYDWRTMDGVAKETKLSRERVFEIIESLSDIVIRSSVPDEKGRDLYSTRKHYSKTQSLVSQVLSASSDKFK
jgi:predicted transcriptional regulator